MELEFFPPSPIVWIMICTVAIVAIYFTWVRKKPPEENAPATQNPNP